MQQEGNAAGHRARCVVSGAGHNEAMCLLAFQWDPAGETPLIVAANRDEFYERPTAPLGWWDGGRILAGRDLRGGGTWMGVTADGRFAALTNHRNPSLAKAGAASRGQIPLRFLEGGESGPAFLASLRQHRSDHNPFNLIVFDGLRLWGYESRHDRILDFPPGLHAVSNGDFDEPWPKVEALLADLALERVDAEALLGRLADPRTFEVERLPRTGVPPDWELGLSAIFVRLSAYGTRASTLLRLGRTSISMLEQSFGPEGPGERQAFTFPRT